MWIFGRQCERILMDWEVYVIIAVIGFIFVASIILFLCLLCRSCHKGIQILKTLTKPYG